MIRKGDFMAATCRFDSSDKDVMVPMGYASKLLLDLKVKLFYKSLIIY